MVSNTTEGFKVLIGVELHPFTMKRTLMQTLVKLKFIYKLASSFIRNSCCIKHILALYFR